jgi:phosphate transport system permease protein
VTAATTPAPVPEVVRRDLSSGKLDVTGRLFTVLLQIALGISLLVLGVLVWDVVSTGSDVLTGRLGDFLTGKMASQAEASGLAQGIRGTFFIGLFTVTLAFPIGVGAALYLEEYAKPGRLTHFIDLNIRNLSGVPSVV